MTPLDLDAVEQRLNDDIAVNGGDYVAAQLQSDTLALVTALRAHRKALRPFAILAEEPNDWPLADEQLVHMVKRTDVLQAAAILSGVTDSTEGA